MSDVAREHRTLLISHTANSERAFVERGHRHVFSVVPNTFMEGTAVAQYLAPRPFRRCMVLGPDYELGHTQAEAFERRLRQPIPDGAIWRIDPTGRLGEGRYAYDGAPAQIPCGGDNLAMDVQGNVYFANDWLTGVWAVDPAGVVFPIVDFRWAKTPLLIRGWADATATAADRLRLLEPNKRPPQFPRVPSTPFFVDGGRWLCLGTYETDLDPAHFNQLPCVRAPVLGRMR